MHTTSFQDSGPWKKWDSFPPTKPNPCGSMQRPLTNPLWGTLNPSGGPRQPTYGSWETLGATGHGPGYSFSPCWQSYTASGLGTWSPSVGHTFHPPNFSHFGTRNVTVDSPAFPCPRSWKAGESTSAPSACPTTTTSLQFSRGGGNPYDFIWVSSSKTLTVPGSSGTATNAWGPRPSWPREGPPGASKCGPGGGARKWPGTMLPTPQHGDCPPPSTCPS